jgi:hypothetical protein
MKSMSVPKIRSMISGSVIWGPVIRKGILGAAAVLAASSMAQEFMAHPSTQDPAVKVTLETLARWEDELSNWGRWGTDDQRGTLNLITPAKTRQAAGLVTEGITVTLQHFVTLEKTIANLCPGRDQLFIA